MDEMDLEGFDERDESVLFPLEWLQDDVGVWSKQNFGVQESKASPGMVLGSLAPLMGIVEELGEFEEAPNADQMADALGDIVIYLCDYCYREGIPLNRVIDYTQIPDRVASPFRNYGLIAVGRMFHATLKRHQGIRGFDDEGKYRGELHRAIQILLAWLDYKATNDTGTDLLSIVERTWERVTKRNWKQKPQTGGAP